jgi:hypothetical protein
MASGLLRVLKKAGTSLQASGRDTCRLQHYLPARQGARLLQQLACQRDLHDAGLRQAFS